MSDYTPLANDPYIRCGCDYFEGTLVDGGVDENLCECGHTYDSHEEGGHACMMQEGDPPDAAFHRLVEEALGGSDD